jgi:hypothetical protein
LAVTTKTPRSTPPKETERAALVLEYAWRACKALREQCDASRRERRATGGALTDAEQDLLRAMLVFAAAGLDSLLKQLIRDALHGLAARDAAVQAELETFVTRQIRPDSELGGDAASGRKFIARILVAPVPLSRITEEYIRDLTGESLQSAEQLFRAAKALGVPERSLEVDAKRVKDIFAVRNQIIHEMDIHLDAKDKQARKRRSRTIDGMNNDADCLLRVGQRVIGAVEEKLRGRRD